MSGPIWDHAAETRPPEQQAALRLQGIQQVLGWMAERSPMYRERLQGAGVHAADIRSMADFAARVPLTNKDDLRAAMDRHASALPHLCVPRDDIVLSGPSAGTSGRQTYQAFDAQDLDMNAKIIARAYWSSGLRPGDVLHLLVTPFTPAADIFRLAAQRIGVQWIIRDDHDASHVPRYVEVARSLKPTFLQAGVATLRSMAQHAAAGAPLPYRRAILMGASLGSEARQEFKRTLGIEVSTLSGQGSDFNLFSTECQACEGEHWHGDDQTLVELIDPTTGTPARADEVGEMVITDFYRRATPHLRWRTEDMVRLHAGTCSCGRTSRRFTLLDRLANRVPVGNSAVYPYQVEAALSRGTDGRNLEFALVRRPRALQSVEVRLLRPVNLTDDDSAAVAARIARQLALDLELPTRVTFHDDLPRVGYKTLRVIDEESDETHT